MEKNEYLKEQRAKRVAALTGKCVIIADSPKHPGHVMYLQDQSICSKGFWTSFLANAKGFGTEEEAGCVLAKLKYNHPRIMWIS